MRYVFFIAINPGRFRIWFSFSSEKLSTLCIMYRIMQWMYQLIYSHRQKIAMIRLRSDNLYIFLTAMDTWSIIYNFWTNISTFWFFFVFLPFHFRFFSMTVQNSIEINRKIAFKKKLTKDRTHQRPTHTNAHAHASMYVRNT